MFFFNATSLIYMLPLTVQPPLKGYRNNRREINLGTNEIPEWVLHQERGTKMRIELPMNWYQGDHFLGFAFFCLYPALSCLYLYCRLEDVDSYEKKEYFSFGSNCGYCGIDGSVLDRLWVVKYRPMMARLNTFDSDQYMQPLNSFLFYDVGWTKIKSYWIHLIIYSPDHQHNHDLKDENSGDNRLAAEDINGSFKMSDDALAHGKMKKPP